MSRPTFFIGMTKTGKLRHLTYAHVCTDECLTTPHPSLCGFKLVRLARNWQTHEPVVFADHWRSRADEPAGDDTCSHCEHAHDEIMRGRIQRD